MHQLRPGPTAPAASTDSGFSRDGLTTLPRRDLGGRADLEARWLHLTRVALPALAAERQWPITADHCFQRVLLDVATGGVWYDAISRRPAYKHIGSEALADAVALGEGLVAGSADLTALNRQSLAWRRARG